MKKRALGVLLFVGLSVVALIFSSIIDYKFFTTFSELITIFLGLIIFVIAFYSKDYTKGSNLLYVGIAFFSISIIDFMHLVNEGGLSNLQNDINVQGQLWISARSIEGFILFYAFTKSNWKRVFDFNFLVVTFSITTFIILFLVSISDFMPKIYTVENGYNYYKYFLDFIVITLFIMAIKSINANEKRIYNKKILTIAISLKIIAEVIFIFETGESGVLEATRYILKYISYVFLFLVFAKDLLQRPYENIFRLFKEKEEELLDLSRRDSLTSLYNHSTSYELIKDIINKNEKSNSSICLFMIDVDDFKVINDKYGHVKGDEILVLIGKMFLSYEGPIQMAGRYGGDEFVALFDKCDVNKPQKIASRIFRRMEELSKEVGIVVTLSIGAAVWEKGLSAKELVKKADYQMYQSKSVGKNTFSL